MCPQVMSFCSERERDDPELRCGARCSTDSDCNQAEGCMVCSRVLVRSLRRYSKITLCQSRDIIDDNACGVEDFEVMYPSPKNSRPLPMFLAIGDSVTMGWFAKIKEALSSFVQPYLIPINGGRASQGARCVHKWIGEANNMDRWDIITYNHGLWDTGRSSAPTPSLVEADRSGENVAKYVDALKAETDILMKTRAAREGRLAFILTTPVANIPVCCPMNVTLPSGSRRSLLTLSCPSLVRKYNEAAIELLATYEPRIHIIDLHGYVNNYCCGSDSCWYTECELQPYQASCNVHFNGKAALEFETIDASKYIGIYVMNHLEGIVRSGD